MDSNSSCGASRSTVAWRKSASTIRILWGIRRALEALATSRPNNTARSTEFNPKRSNLLPPGQDNETQERFDAKYQFDMDSIAAVYGTGGGDAKTSENEWPHQMGCQIPAQAVAVIERFKARVIPEMLSIGLALSNILSEPAGRSLIQRTVHMPRIASHFIDKQQFTTPACCLLLSLAILLRLIQRFGNRRRRQSPSRVMDRRACSEHISSAAPQIFVPDSPCQRRRR